MTLTPRIFWIAIGLYVVVRLGLAALNYAGDARPEARERALRHFDAAAIDRGVEYHRAGFAVSVVYFLLSLAVLVAIVVSGVAPRLAEGCLQLAGGRRWLQTALFISALLWAVWIADLPFQYYFGLVLERRFGFTDLSLGGWFVFQLKNQLVAWILVALVGTLGYALVRQFPRTWVAIVPAGALCLQFGLTLLFPVLFLPIFYKISPVENAEVAEAIQDLSDRAGFSVASLYQIDASRYSQHTNAFFTGFGNQKKIYLYDTLINDHTPQEVAATFAHEYGHWKHNHVLKGLVLSSLGVIAACLAIYFGYPVLERAQFLRLGPLGDVSNLPALLLVASIVAFFLQPVSNSVSRHFEREADRVGAQFAPSSAVFVNDFKTMAQTNRSHLLPHPAVVFWRFSHPPVLDRIESVSSP